MEGGGQGQGPQMQALPARVDSLHQAAVGMACWMACWPLPQPTVLVKMTGRGPSCKIRIWDVGGVRDAGMADLLKDCYCCRW